MNGDNQQLATIFAAIAGFYLIGYLLLATAIIVPMWFISKKAGLTPWLSLLCIFPLTGLIFFYILAFTNWKVIPAPVQVWTSPQPPYPPPPQA